LKDPLKNQKMSATPNPAISQPESIGKWLRHFAVGGLFALVLFIPRYCTRGAIPALGCFSGFFWESAERPW